MHGIGVAYQGVGYCHFTLSSSPRRSVGGTRNPGDFSLRRQERSETSPADRNAGRWHRLR